MKIKWHLGCIDRARTMEDRYYALDSLSVELGRQHGYVYLMHMETTPYYKIGKSVDPEHRIFTSVILPMDIVLVHSIETDMMSCLEKDLHTYFAVQRIRGEWFELTDADVEYIKAYGPARYPYAEIAREELLWYYGKP